MCPPAVSMPSLHMQGRINCRTPPCHCHTSDARPLPILGIILHSKGLGCLSNRMTRHRSNITTLGEPRPNIASSTHTINAPYDPGRERRRGEQGLCSWARAVRRSDIEGGEEARRREEDARVGEDASRAEPTTHPIEVSSINQHPLPPGRVIRHDSGGVELTVFRSRIRTCGGPARLPRRRWCSYRTRISSRGTWRGRSGRDPRSAFRRGTWPCQCHISK